MPKICSKCNSQTNDTANFCQQCGQQLIGQPLNPAGQPINPVWIMAMQEKIKDARYGEIICLAWAWIGFVLTALIIITLFVLRTQWESIDWVERLGFVMMIGFVILFGVAGIKRDTFKNQKEKLIDQLEKGK